MEHFEDIIDRWNTSAKERGVNSIGGDATQDEILDIASAVAKYLANHYEKGEVITGPVNHTFKWYGYADDYKRVATSARGEVHDALIEAGIIERQGGPRSPRFKILDISASTDPVATDTPPPSWWEDDNYNRRVPGLWQHLEVFGVLEDPEVKGQVKLYLRDENDNEYEVLMT